MNNVWLSALFGDGKNPRVKHIVCDDEGNPLLFDTQPNALQFWTKYKDRFSVPECFDRKLDRVSPQVVREEHPDDVLYDLIDEGERQVIKPKEGFTIYSDDQTIPQFM